MQESIESLRTELEERLRFETLLAEISAGFVNLPADQVDGEIEAAQRRFCELLDLDRSSLWQASKKEPVSLFMTHRYQPRGTPPPPGLFIEELFPWTRQKVLAGETVIFTKTSDLPPEAGRDRENYGLIGVKSDVIVPLSVGGGPPFGLLTFAVMREERDWPETVVRGFRLIAQLFANALARKLAEEALREREIRLSLAASSAEVGLWSVEVETGEIWATEKGWEVLGLARGSRLTEETFYRMVHPEDRERLRQTLRQVPSSEKESRVEYRIIKPDGSVGWRIFRGRPHLSPAGRLDRWIGASVDITERKRIAEQLQANLLEIAGLKQRLEEENIYLRKEAELLYTHEEIIGQSEAIRKVLADIEKVARTDSTVLITGETGTGKDLIARAIHHLSNRKGRLMVTVNCASLPPTLIESELFGREKGAYTGALTRQMGRFEIANGSTLFLDEIGELPLELQAKFLKVLQDGEFERVGSVATIKVDVRIIAATNRNLAEEIRRGKFRQDLFYRMSVFPIRAPPLREHPEDIPLLINSLVEEFGKRMGKRIHSVPRKTMEDLQRYSWPGNVRELRNLIEQAFIISSGDALRIQVPREKVSEHSRPLTADEMERQHIMKVLEMTKWRIKGSHGAAEILGLKPSTLYSRMVKFGIVSPHKKDDI